MKRSMLVVWGVMVIALLFCSRTPVFAAGCVVRSTGCNTVTSGTLDSSDCETSPRRGGYYAEQIAFDGTAGQQVTVTAAWSGVDGYIYLQSPSGTVVAEDDDFNSTSGSQIADYTLGMGGTWIIWATTYGKEATGAYTMRIECTGTGTECTVRNATCNSEIPGTIDQGDCDSGPRGSGHHAERIVFYGRAGQSVTITALWSGGLDGFLYLEDPEGNVAVYDDDFNSMAASQIADYTLGDEGEWSIWATTYREGATGEYLIHIDCGGDCTVRDAGCDSQVSGDLTDLDCDTSPRGNDFYAEQVTFDGSVGQSVTITAHWGDVDGYLYLEDPAGNVVAQNDDFGSSAFSQIAGYTLDATGTWVVWATTYADENTGTYSIEIVCDSQGGCSSREAACNEPLTGRIDSLDCESSPRGTGYLAEKILFTGSAGQTVSITAQWDGVDGFLYLVSPQGQVAAQNDDHESSASSQIADYTLGVGGTWELWVTTFQKGMTGGYTVQFDCETFGPAGEVLDFEVLWLPVLNTFNRIFGPLWPGFTISIPVGLRATVSAESLEPLLELDSPMSIAGILEIFGISELSMATAYPQFQDQYDLLQPILESISQGLVELPAMDRQLAASLFSNGATVTLAPELGLVSTPVGAGAPTAGQGIAYMLNVEPVYD